MMEPIERIHVADDGSEHATWTLYYALRMARRLDPPLVQMLRVPQRGASPTKAHDERQARLAEQLGVRLVHRTLPSARDVPAALADHVQPGPSDVVLVGFRAHRHGRGLALGTVGQALLARHDHAVLAMRVVAPGNLGLPRVAALGLSESPGLVERLAPAVQLLAPDLERLMLLHVVEVQRRFYGALTYARLRELEGRGQATLARCAAALRRALGPLPRLERRTSVAESWPTQLVMDAHRTRAHLLLLGASDQLLPRRFTLSNPLETVLRNAACDVAVFRAASRAAP
jgi:nucleotide-binding universal stress UspA family protein